MRLGFKTGSCVLVMESWFVEDVVEDGAGE